MVNPKEIRNFATDPESQAKWVDEHFDEIVDSYIRTHGNKLDPDELRNAFAAIGYDGKNVPEYRNQEKRVVRAVYDKMLQEAVANGETSITLLTGAGGAGKSTSTQNMDFSGRGLVYDSAFNDFKSLNRVINRAKELGMKDIQVVAVYNDANTSFENTVRRGLEKGRFLSLDYLVDSLQRNQGKLSQLRQTHPDVEIVTIDNSGNKATERPEGGRVSLDEAKKWDYSVNDAKLNELLDIFENGINEGRFTEDQIASIGRGLRNVTRRVGDITTDTRERVDRIGRRIRQENVGDLRPGSSGEQRGSGRGDLVSPADGEVQESSAERPAKGEQGAPRQTPGAEAAADGETRSEEAGKPGASDDNGPEPPAAGAGISGSGRSGQHGSATGGAGEGSAGGAGNGSGSGNTGGGSGPRSEGGSRGTESGGTGPIAVDQKTGRLYQKRVEANIGRTFVFAKGDGRSSTLTIKRIDHNGNAVVVKQDFDAHGNAIGQPKEQRYHFTRVADAIGRGIWKKQLTTEEQLRDRYKFKVGDIPVIDVLTEEEQQQVLDAVNRGDKDEIGNLTGELIEKHRDDFILRGRDVRNEKVKKAFGRSGRGERLRGVRDQYRAFPEASVFLEDDSMQPQTIEEYVADALGDVPKAGDGFLAYTSYDQGGNTIVGLKDETGFGSRGFSGDTKGFNPWLAPNGKGISLKQFAESIREQLPEGLKEQFSDQDIRNIIHSVLTGAEKPTDIANYILRNRVEQAENAAKHTEDGWIDEPNFQKIAEQINQRQHMVESDFGAFDSALKKLDEREISIDDPELLKEYGLKNVILSRLGDHLTLTHFIANEQGKGNGTRFMNDLARLADQKGWTLAVTPDTSFGGTSVKRLKDFYKRFGFKDNRGRNADFETRESMVRRPKDYQPDSPEKQEEKLRNAIVDHLREIGVDVNDDWKVGQRILDDYNGRITGEEVDEEPKAQKVSDQETLDKLNNEPTVKRYRAMQLIDGKLYPPMSAKVDGEMRQPTEIGVWEQAEERPDLIKNGKFVLNKGQKGQGNVPAAYNPYFHTSTSGLNDQFTSAYKRPELVVVEVEVPESELTSGYKAEGAKDAVGNVDWHSGVVNGQLPADRQRQVTLSRYSKVNRIVPDSEVADMIAKQLEGTNVEVPYNVVTPQLRKELESRGVKISDKPAGSVTEDINGNPIRQQKVEKPIFVSNAQKAVEGIKQEKATPEQWLKMIEKNGGLKAGEDKWLGLSDWLKEQQAEGKKSLTKQDVEDYIRKNQIEVEEQRYSEGISDNAQFMLDQYNQEFRDLIDQGEEETGSIYASDWADWAYEQMVDQYGDDFRDAFEYQGRGTASELVPIMDWGDDLSGAAKYYLNMGGDSELPINSTRLEYTTNGLENNREIALTVPSIDPYGESDDIHFGDADNGRAVAWIRFGETTDKDGKRVLVIDEIQSKRHQDAREKGYRNDNIKQIEQAEKEIDDAIDKIKEFRKELSEKYNYDSIEGNVIEKTKTFLSRWTPEENAKMQDLEYIVEEAKKRRDNLPMRDVLVPDAPFEKNWHELAMKRMLRYAAENGYDKVAWTTGDQQAQRYNIGDVVNAIDVYPHPDTKDRQVILYQPNGDSIDLSVDSNGIIEVGQFGGHRLEDVVGKSLAEEIYNATEKKKIEGESLRVGADGMKGFYDQMLPRFMDKYGKKWSVKTGEVNLPNLKDTYLENGHTKIKNGLTMHSVDVTPEMKESVMEGQPMFFRTKDGHAYGYTYKGKIYLDPRIATAETPVHEYGHLWSEMKRQTSPDEWNHIKQVMLTDKLVQPIIEKVRRDYPELSRSGREDDFIEEIITQFSGKRGTERLREIANEIAAENGGVFGKAEAVTAMQRLKNILNRFWEGVAKMMGWKYRNANQIADRIMADMLNGVNPRERMKEAASANVRGQKEADRTLMGVHNISEEKLKKALKLGGLANPSMAVVDTKRNMLSDYGEISLIPRSSMIDARTGRNAGTFTADAWTPTYPKVEKRMSDKGQSQFWKDLRKINEEAGEMGTKMRMAFDTWLDHETGEERLAYWYLKDRGMNPETVVYKTPYSKEMTDRFEELTERGNKDIRQLTDDELKEVADMYHAYKESIGEPVTPAEERIRLMEEKIDFSKETPFTMLRKQRLEDLKKYGEAVNTLRDFVDGVRRYAYDDGKVDTEATIRKAYETLESQNLQDDFKAWLDQKTQDYGIEEWLYNGTDNQGRQKYVRNTLENASRLMKKEGLNGALGWSSLGSWIATVANKEKTLEGIRKNKKNLDTTEEEHDAFKERWSNLLFPIVEKMGNGDPFHGDNIMKDILEHKDYAGYYKREYGKELTPDEKTTIDKFIKEVQNDFPTGYFETKFERPVELSEFEVAVVPESTSPEVVEALKNAGLDVRTYDTSDYDTKEDKRYKATMDAVSGRDDIRFQLVGKKGAAEADRIEGDTRHMDNLKIAEQMDKDGKNVFSIWAATGWNKGKDGQWRYETPDPDVNVIEAYDNAQKTQKTKARELQKKQDQLLDEYGKLSGSIPHKLDSRYTEEQKTKYREMRKRREALWKEYMAASGEYDKFKNEASKSVSARLADVIGEDNKLFTYYPELKDINVIFSRTMQPGTAGSYGDGSIELSIPDTIRFNDKELDNESIYGTLLHEIQHAVQDIEGFAPGGNLYTSTTPEGINDIIRRKESKIAHLRKLLDANRRIIEDPEELKDAAVLDGRSEKEEKDHLYEEINDQAAEIDNIKLQIERLKHTKAPSMTDAKDLYNRLAGEVEARNATERYGMDERRRKQLPPSETEDVPREDQVVISDKSGDQDAIIVDLQPKFVKMPEKQIEDLYHEGLLPGESLNMRDRVNNMSPRELVEQYERLNNEMLDEKGLNVDEQEDAFRQKWADEHGWPPKQGSGFGHAMAEFSAMMSKKYTFNKMALRWDIMDRIKELGLDSYIDPDLKGSVNIDDLPEKETAEFIRMQRADSNPEPELTPEERQYWNKYEADMKKWRERNAIADGVEGPSEKPKMRPGESAIDYAKRLVAHNREKALWQTAPKIEDYRQKREDKDWLEAARENEKRYPDSPSAKMRRAAAEFQQIRRAMSQQKAYDKSTVKAVVDFANDYMKEGFGDNLSRGEIERLLSSVKNATGAKDIRKYVDNIMNILTDNYLRNLDQRVQKLSSTKELSKTAQGVEKQGKLELKGQRMIQAFRQAREGRMDADKIRERMAEVAEKMARSDDEAPMWEQEYEGLGIALQYAENIEASRDEYADLDREYKDAIKDYKDSGRSYKDQQEYLESLDQAMMENKIERIGMFGDIINRLQGNIAESMEGAREFVEREKERVKHIQQIANFDLAGKDMGALREKSKGKPANFFLQPLGTFEQMLKQFGSRNANGEGYLYDYFMRNWMDSTDQAFLNEQRAKEELDAKAREVFGDKVRRWSDLYEIARRLPSMDVEVFDGEEPKTFKLNQGNLLYIYMADKMVDGRMKLRKMGIDEETVQQIKDFLDPRLVELGDWLQDKYLVQKRNEYNKVHERMFGAPMAAIDHYFPLKVLGDARYQEQDVANMADQDAVLPSTITGNIIKRRRNSLPLDILHTDALSLAIEHVEDMERWAATAEWNKDINTLLSYTTFRNKVKNMDTIYGSGDALWNSFADTARMAAGTYKPKAKPGSVDAAISNIAKGVTAAKISFRAYTALKQLLSAPAFLHDVRIDDFVKNSVNPYGSWKWAMENMPVFKKRWKSRQVGDTRLMDDPTDWKLWKTNIVQMANRMGMSPNALVDGVTCAVGARSIYESRYRKYKDIGASDEVARKRALQDAEIGYNLTQQSSEGAFTSAIQKDRTVAANMLSVFRNSSMSYTRQWVDAARNLKKRSQKGYKEDSIKFMTRQFQDQFDLDETQAKRAAELEYAREGRRDVARLLNMMFGVTMAWNLGASLPYLLIGDDDNTKKEMLTDAMMKGLIAGPTEGFAAGNIWSDLMGRTFASEETRKAFKEGGLGAAADAALKQGGDYEVNPLPLMADIQSMIKKMGYDKYAAAQDVFNIAMQSAVGVNPQTFTDMWNAAMDYGAPGWDGRNYYPDDENLSRPKELALFMMRLLNAPTSSWRNKYIDELGMNAEDAKKLPYDEMAKRYAHYKHWKDAPIMGWLRGAEGRNEKIDKLRGQFDKAVEERMNRLTDAELKDNLARSIDPEEKRRYAKIAAKRMGVAPGPDSQKPDDQHWYQEYYQERMTIEDINEDEMLNAKKKDLRDDDIKKEVNKRLDWIRDGKYNTENGRKGNRKKGNEPELMAPGKRQLTSVDEAIGNDQRNEEIMRNIRKWRKEALEMMLRAESDNRK